MAKDPSGIAVHCSGWRSPVNTGASWPDLDEAEYEYIAMQTKLHQWAAS